MEVDCVLEGFDNVIKRLSNMSAFEAEIKEAVKEITDALRKALIQHTPVLTGKLRDGWKSAYVIKRTDDGFLVELINAVDYARAVNYGHWVYNQLGGPYLVKKRAVQIDGRWGQSENPYRVNGSFFVEKGALQTENQVETILTAHLEQYWRWCFNGK